MSQRRVVSARAFAKINVTLRVLGRRLDGYHELRTVFQSIALHDRLTFEVSPAQPFALTCTNPQCPTDRTNLVWRAAELVWRAAGRSGPVRGVHVTIDKRIPMQAGLGGGSSDAAAALRALAHLWDPRVRTTQLAEMAAALGADVPFFLRGGTALGVNRGDRLFPLVDPAPAWVVLVQPDFGVSTTDAYRWFDERQPPRSAPDPVDGPYGDGGNDLQPVVARRHPAIARLVGTLRGQGSRWAAMSGSGSACFGLFDDGDTARSAAAALSAPGQRVWLTRTQTARQFARRSATVPR